MATRKKIPSLGEQIRAVRRARRLTQAELAAAGGLDQSLISKFERDLRQPSILQLIALARPLRAHFTMDSKTIVFEAEP